LINHAAEALLFFSIDGYEMTVIANDFVPVEPYQTDLVVMGVGQRTDVIVTGKSNAKEAVYMRVTEGPSGLGPAGQTGCSLNTGVSIEAIAPIYYENADTSILPNTTSDIDPSRYLFPNNCGNQPLSETVPSYAMEVKQPDKTLNFLMTGNYNSTGAFVWYMNNVTFMGDYNGESATHGFDTYRH
jgi:FtsP/CotA-like multicopper oxidase with cupredoxin domain